MFITRRKLRAVVLEAIKQARECYDATDKSDEQRKRDAWMLYSGELGMALYVLNRLAGGPK